MAKKIKLDAEAIRGFCNSLLISKFEAATQIPLLLMELWGLLCEGWARLAIAAPRGHAKSTGVTFIYVLACTLFRVEMFVLIVSATYKQAVKHLFEIRKEINENEKLQQLFGFEAFSKEAEDELIVRFKDGYEFCIAARGSGQDMRGLKWNNHRPGLVICDDMESDDSVGTSDAREALRQWFFTSLMYILPPTGRLVLIGTLLHTDSLLARLMPARQLMDLNIPKELIATPLKEYTDHPLYWKAVKYRAYSDDLESILWPDRFTKESLVGIRDASASQGKLDAHRQEMLNIPYDESRSLFGVQFFLPMNEKDMEKRLEYYVGIDLAVSTAEYSDYSAFVVAGMDSVGMLYVVEVIRDRIDTSQSIEVMIDLQKRYKPQFMVIEKGVIDKSIGPFLQKEMVRRNTFIHLTKIRAVGDKRKRAQSIAGRMQVGGVKFDRDSTWFLPFQSELLSFSGSSSSGQHDDQVDAFAYIGLALNRLADAPTEEERERQELEEEMNQEQEEPEKPYDPWGDLFPEGQSQITGY